MLQPSPSLGSKLPSFTMMASSHFSTPTILQSEFFRAVSVVPVLNTTPRGRPFNPSTLPGVTLPEYLNSQASNLRHGFRQSSGLLGSPHLGQDASVPAFDDSHSGDPPPQDSGRYAAIARSTRSTGRATKGHEGIESPALETASVEGTAVKVSGGEVDKVQSSLVRSSDAPPDSSNDGGFKPLDQDAVLAAIRDDQRRLTPNRSSQEDGNRYGQNKNGLTPPDSGRNVCGDNANRMSSEAENEDIAQATRKARAESFTGTPATPDEQLRLEEAQSTQQHGSQTTQPSSDLPSQFLQGSLDDGDPMVGVSSLHTEADSNTIPDDHLDDENDTCARPTLGLRDGMNGEASKDLMLSRRPPMRIDTGVPSTSGASSVPSQNKSAPTTGNVSQSATPSRSTHPVSIAQSPPERMTTRVSSGALRHKSVSEILGEAPKSAQAHAEKLNAETHHEDSAALQTPKSALSMVSPDPVIFKQRLNELNQKEKSSKLSTVVFAKPQHASKSRILEVTERPDSIVEETHIKDRDYLFTWLVAQVYTPSSSHPVERKPLNNLLKQAHKTLTTSDHYIDFHERQDCRILSKIQELQAKGKWSLRQPVRCPEPHRPATHWDVLLGQMKWMRTDFREERKWKAAGAKYVADACAQWFNSSPEDRKSLQVQVKVTNPHLETQPSTAAPTPDLIPSAEDDETETMDEAFSDATLGEPPAAIFSLPPDMFVFGLNRSPVSDKILHELPLYMPSAEAESGALRMAEFSPDAPWKVEIVPTSKYTQGKIASREEGPPRKRSRYSYSDSDRPHAIPTNKPSEQAKLVREPENKDVALFNPEHKHIRDRIHTGHAFRPPSEHIMPSQSFFECRQSSQWTMAEDDELRRLVREYAYNWSLISNCLSPSSTFSSGAERRTPWECFERWISLEGLPAEMSKVNYFRAYHSRLQQAQRAYEAQQQQLIQQHPNNAAQLSRRRSTQPFTVDRRKNNKHIHLIDAMRKQAKKRENKLLKDQHISTAASLRKNNEPQKPRQQMHTPREFSRMKYESQVKREEQVKAARIQFWHQQQQRVSFFQADFPSRLTDMKKASMSQRAAGSQQPGQQPSGAQPPRNLVPGAPNGSSPNMAAATPHLRAGNGPGVPQMHRPMNGQANGALPTNTQGVPHAPMQPHMQMQMGQRLPPQMGQNVLYAATQVQAEQQAQLQRQRQLQHSQMTGQAGSSNMQNLNPLAQNNPNMLGSMDGRSSPAMNGAQQPPGNSASPNMTQPQTLSSGLTPAVNQIQNQIKLRNPQASPEQIRSATTEQLYRMSQQHAAHQAMQMATGNANTGAVATNGNLPGMGTPSPMQQQAMMVNAGSPMLNPQQYAQLMMEQQKKQSSQRSGSVGSSAQAMNGGSRGATPLNQRSGSALGGRGLSQSPRQGQAGVAGGQ